MTRDLACASGVDLLMDYLEDALPKDLRDRIESHVAACERCTAFVASYREAPRVVREAASFGMPPELEESLMVFLRGRR